MSDDLVQRLRDHAQLHDGLASTGDPDQAQWGDDLRAAADAIEDADAIRKLAAFGEWCAREFRSSLADIDGGSAQDAMERFGVLVKRSVTKPCGDDCVCAEYGDFPHDCYVFDDGVFDAMDRIAKERK